jgi:hypothetical protein
VLDNRGADPFSSLIPLAQLGVARALSAGGHVAEARTAYETVLRTWEHADPDLPVLLAARKEAAELSTARPVSSRSLLPKGSTAPDGPHEGRR